MHTYQITGAWNHVDLSGAESFDTKTAQFAQPISRDGLLKHASRSEIQAIIRGLTVEIGDLDSDDCQGICQRCEKAGFWVTREQVAALLREI